MSEARSPFVTTQWLLENLNEVTPVDGSWYLPNEGRDPEQEFLDGHIPGAARFNLDAVSAFGQLPHMMPDAADFALAVSGLGISVSDTIVVYDTAGLFSAPRVRWMFRCFGAKDVFLLEGGLPKWHAEGNPVESGHSTRTAARFVARLDAGAIADQRDVLNASTAGSPQIIDARIAARFAGTVPEPRPGVRAGHIPGSLNIPYSSLIVNGRMKGKTDIEAVFSEAGVLLSEPAITTCGSGITAAVVSLALEIVGAQDVALYDGSWAEWGADPDLPIANGPVVT